jgi:neopullulanase
VVRVHGKSPGLFAASRIGNDGRELVVAFNTSMSTVVAQIEVEATSAVFSALRGACAAKASAPGSFRVEVPPLGYVVCQGAVQ